MNIQDQKQFARNTRLKLEAISKWDTDIETFEVDTFDKQLADQLRTVSGSARNALTYMELRNG